MSCSVCKEKTNQGYALSRIVNEWVNSIENDLNDDETSWTKKIIIFMMN